MQKYIKGKKLEEQMLTLGVSMQGDTSPVQVELVDVKIVKCINGLDTRRAKEERTQKYRRVPAEAWCV